ncbi:MAG: aminopeptidase [Prevotella sp.]|nr:aminopeptidase [Prevotella sp.]
MKTRKQCVILVALLCTLTGMAADNNQKKVFTTVKANPITSIKNQNKSGTCWDFATIGFLEGEILRATGKTYDLCEMFVASNDYVDCAEYHVRMHGNSRFSEGGSCDDVIEVIRRHGICPEQAMPRPGTLVGDTLANFNEFFAVLEPYVKSVANDTKKRLSTQWKAGLQGILDAYLGKKPETFTYEGRSYTPQTFAQSLGINLSDYVSLTSFTHHPFNEWFVIEAPYKWRPRPSFNIPLQEMMKTIDDTLASGYNVAWGGDVSGNGFSRKGTAALADSLHLKVTQEQRQQLFDQWDSTYDHVMLIYGTAKDQDGKDHYMVKNSWGKAGDYEGTWYMSKEYIALYTTYVFLNRHALTDDLLQRMATANR